MTKQGASAKPPQEGLTRAETREVKERRRLRAAVVYEIIRLEGEAELARNYPHHLHHCLGRLHPHHRRIGGGHIVEAIYMYLTGEVGFGQAFGGFFVPTLLGNVAGGTVLFSLISYAQVREELEG